MDGFGGALRRFRTDLGLTQQEFADSLPERFARSTIANVEVGREAPSERLWAALTTAHPHAAEVLGTAFDQARHRVCDTAAASSEDRQPGINPARIQLGGPFHIERLDLTYVFRESRAPEEILEVRTVKALKDRTDSYVLKMKSTNSSEFHAAPEVLWGGTLADTTRAHADGQTIYLRQLQFDPMLRRGQRHTFALRSWVERDPEPDTAVSVTLSLRTELVCIHLNFLGPRPLALWRYGPIADDSLRPTTPTHPSGEPVTLGPDGLATATFTHPPTGSEHGIGWTWD